MTRHVGELRFDTLALGDVFMDSDPAAIFERPVRYRDDAAIIELPEEGSGLALKVCCVSDRLLWRGLLFDAAFQDLPVRRPGLRELGRDAVHFCIPGVADDQSRGAVIHGEAVRHVVQANVELGIESLEL